MSIVDLADEKLGTSDVVRPNRTSVGHAFAEHAKARDGDSLSRNVFTRRNEHFRRPRHDKAVRNFRSALHRRRKDLSQAERSETPRRVLSRKLFSADVQ